MVAQSPYTEASFVLVVKPLKARVDPLIPSSLSHWTSNNGVVTFFGFHGITTTSFTVDEDFLDPDHLKS